MNPGELISRERLAVAVFVLLLLAGLLGVGLLHGRGVGSTAAPEVVPGPQPPTPSPAGPSGSPGSGTSANASGGGTASDPVTPSAGNPHGTSSGGSQGGAAPSPGGTGRPTPPPAPAPPPPSPPPAGKPANVPFHVSGDASGLAPGASTVIALTLRNPNSVRIRVTRVTVAVSADSTPSGCSSATNLVLQQATGISPGSPVTIPARGSVTLNTFPRAPRIGFRDLATNQDSCRGTSFRLTYTGSAHS